MATKLHLLATAYLCIIGVASATHCNPQPGKAENCKEYGDDSTGLIQHRVQVNRITKDGRQEHLKAQGVDDSHHRAFSFAGLLDSATALASKDGHMANVSLTHRGKTYNFDLESTTIFTPNAKIITFTSQGRQESAPGKSKIFQSRVEGKWATVILNSDASFSGLFEDGDTIMSVEPVQHSENELALSLLGSYQGTGQAYYMQFIDFQKLDMPILQQSKASGSAPRRAEPTKFYPGCYPGDDKMHQFVMGFGATFVSYVKYKEGLQARIEGSIAKASHIYEKQVHMKLKASYLTLVKSKQGAPDWASEECPKDGHHNLNAVLGAMYNDIGGDDLESAGAVHVFDTCGSPGGTVGIGYMDSICSSSALGVTKLHQSNAGFTTLAHELGHNWNLGHTIAIEGLMGWVKKLNGVEQFNVAESKTPLCESISKNLESCSSQGYVLDANGKPVVYTTTTTTAPTTTPEPPAPGSLFHVTIGSCKTVGLNCVQSPNYPDKYGSEEVCEIKVLPAAWTGKSIKVESFLTENNYDYLQVNNHQYHGSVGPKGVKPTTDIRWSSDTTKEETGWKLCGVSGTAPPPTPAPPSKQKMFSVVEGDCEEVGLNSHCLQSPNYPSLYANDERCKVDIGDWTGKHIHVESFQTEADYDFLIVNSIKYSGDKGPKEVVPTGRLEWESDWSENAMGWKICAVGVPGS